MTRLAGKNALITGAARGIGRAFAQAYIAEGARVCIADIDFERAQKTAQDLGPSAIAVSLDVTKQDSIDAAVAQTIATLGQIDILINNAALFTAAPIVEVDRADYQRVFDINVSGTLFMMQAVARHMIGRGIRGKIINMGSMLTQFRLVSLMGNTGPVWMPFLPSLKTNLWARKNERSAQPSHMGVWEPLMI